MHWVRNTFVNRPNWTKALLLYGSIFHEIEFSFFQLCVSFSFRILIPMSSILQLQVASDSVALSECPSLSSLCYCNCQSTHRNYQINISSSFNCQLMASCASKAVTYHKRSLWDSLWIPHVAFVTVLEEVSTDGCNILWKEQSLQYFTSNSVSYLVTLPQLGWLHHHFLPFENKTPCWFFANISLQRSFLSKLIRIHYNLNIFRSKFSLGQLSTDFQI